jgi:hypothetical protein
MNLNPFKKMNFKERLIFASIQLTTFVIIYILSRTVLSDIYVLEWTADEYYLYIWVLVLLFSLLKKTILSLSLTIGNVFGILFGQILGDIIRNGNIQKITDTMKEEQKYFLMNHKGVFIWIFTILAFLLLGTIASFINKRTQEDANKKQGPTRF